MIAVSFMNVLIDVSRIAMFCGLIVLAIAILWIGAYELGGWDNYGYSVKKWVSALVAVVLAIPIGAFFITWGISLWGDETPNTFSTSGGQGPDTVCWYELVDDDTVIMAGKTPVIVDGEETRTVCAKNPTAIPNKIKTGEQ